VYLLNEVPRDEIILSNNKKSEAAQIVAVYRIENKINNP